MLTADSPALLLAEALLRSAADDDFEEEKEGEDVDEYVVQYRTSNADSAHSGHVQSTGVSGYYADKH